MLKIKYNPMSLIIMNALLLILWLVFASSAKLNYSMKLNTKDAANNQAAANASKAEEFKKPISIMTSRLNCTVACSQANNAIITKCEADRNAKQYAAKTYQAWDDAVKDFYKCIPAKSSSVVIAEQACRAAFLKWEKKQIV